MGDFIKALAFIGILAAGVFYWVSNRPQPVPPPPPPVVVPPPTPTPTPMPVKPDQTSRIWTDADGRTFEGSLVTVKGKNVVIRRMSDSSYFKVTLRTFAQRDIDFVLLQLDRAEKLGITLEGPTPAVYTLVRKLDIKGFLVKVAAPPSRGRLASRSG